MAAPTYDLDSKVNKDEIKDLIDEENENEELEEKIFNFFKNDTLNNPKFWKDFMTYFAIPFIQGAFYGLGEFVAHATVAKYGFLKKPYNQLPEKKQRFKVNSRNNTEPVAVAMGVDKGIYEQLVFQTVMEQSNKMMKNNNQNIDNTKNPKIIRKEEIFGLKDLINTENKNNLVIRRNYLF
ncbi:hypothetical protein H8356DRAFT_1724367 [Neocallimastix lanati (nom. inval.)]|jgi:hypothetical protein|uniref:Uncharacterized protein n=1 Tax=Neocallimastix californiae TaxID=1754190 RepID=A0A1Y2AFI5_9FUNG|nr:hypothetical protein H8356DRAFT_1724367 [Neocallimastix sp. JGI-2020a]ORY21204.1 hypothetical protein LY90DRAFT_707573 [Neocallimastix californiae]|eukprot:ORY21204.1 hypothetical protein LY90DRAFT_707573 [Neocallimastix californiae]